MSSAKESQASQAVSSDAWDSLVQRSIEAWKASDLRTEPLAKSFLQSYKSLDDFLDEKFIMFWMFQRRDAFLSQRSMTKWSRDRLDDYVLFPALNGFVMRNECFFVSHFWRSKTDPDPGGEYLRLVQDDLRHEKWSYIWVDWTCAPQHPRTPKEETYFLRTLQTMSGIIRNCGFTWRYPPFEPRLWILYEVAEYALTADLGLASVETPDAQEFADHIREMLRDGVRPVLDKHGYKCTDERDKKFLTSWLEVLVLLTNLGLDIGETRRIFDYLTWHRHLGTMVLKTSSGVLELCRFDGKLSFQGRSYSFTPFFQLVSLPSSNTGPVHEI